MASPSPFPEGLEPEHAIEHSDLALCVISGQGELRCRDPPIVVKQEKGGSLVFVTFVALPEEAFRLFVCNYGTVDVGADLSFGGEYLGKWLIAREPQAWHHVACDSLFRFHESYDRQSKVFEPTTIEIRFQLLHEVQDGSQEASLVPVIERQPSPEDGPSYIRPRDDVMQSAFAAPEDDQFLTFVILFYPPVPTMTFPSISTTSIPSLEPGPASPSSSDTPSSSETSSTRSSDSISQMSDDELQGALTEHRSSRFLLPARLTPGFWGKLPVDSFCRRYELPEEIASVLTQMQVKDAHGLSRVYLHELRDNGLALRSINMLRLAVIRFSSESKP